jgi:hypothetical protein
MCTGLRRCVLRGSVRSTRESRAVNRCGGCCVCAQEKLGPQCMRWLEDQVASIREAATKTLQKIAQVRGCTWGVYSCAVGASSCMLRGISLTVACSVTHSTAVHSRVLTGALDCCRVRVCVVALRRSLVPSGRRSTLCLRCWRWSRTLTTCTA